ncbi:MAG: phosphatase PAP2 family protein [Novosphingobium sp.]
MLLPSRLRFDQTFERIESHAGLAPLRRWLLELGEREIAIVAWAWRGTERASLRHTAILVSWLGNGAIYVLLAAVLLLTLDGVWRPLGVAAVCVLAAHLVYPWAKAAARRLRPCELYAELAPRLPLLDRLSFPSGHIMTLSAALVPLVFAFPQVWPGAAAIWLLMAWSRVACAHHYPSDVLAGGALGVLIAAPTSWLLL